MGEPEAIEAKFAHVHSKRVWWLSVVVVVTCCCVISVCIHVHACACHLYKCTYMCMCYLSVFSLYYFQFKGCTS